MLIIEKDPKSRAYNLLDPIYQTDVVELSNCIPAIR